MMRQQQLALGIDLHIPDWFGWWFSGLVDGEGCFFLSVNTQGYKGKEYKQKYLSCALSIGLRADDLGILEMIQSTLRVGNIKFNPQTNSKSNPIFVWKVTRLLDLQWVMIPLLDEYPLQSKKRKDYIVWKEAVQLLIAVRGGRKICRWTDETWAIACGLIEKIKNVRVYDPGPACIWQVS